MAGTSSSVERLKPSQLKVEIKKAWLTSLKKTDKFFMGQDRALSAMNFAASVRHQGFNLYVMGQPGFGQQKAVIEVLERAASGRRPPSDWVYVNNFENPDVPQAIQMPNGKAHALRRAMEGMINDLANDIPAIFESEDYQNKRQLIEDEFSDVQEKAFGELVKSTHEKNLVLLRTPMGFAIVAAREGKAIKPEEFAALPKTEQDEINQLIGEQQLQLEQFLKQIPKREKEHRHQVEELNKVMAKNGVDDAIEDLLKVYSDIKSVSVFLEAVRQDLIQNADLFLNENRQTQVGSFPVTTTKHFEMRQFQRYRINVLVGAGEEKRSGAPIVIATLPTYSNLIGRVEHLQDMGALVTNFSMIKAGELHRANGGYLVIDARQLLSEPYAWDALKRALKTSEIRISSVGERLSLMSTVSLAPDAIPLDVRVVLIGDRQTYYLLSYYDPDFTSLFKIAADLDDKITVSRKSAAALAGSLLATADARGLRSLDPDGLSEMLTEATRIANDTERFSLNREQISDILVEADYWAENDNKDVIGREEIEKAITKIEDRAGRVRELSHEAIDRDITLIDTDGEIVGQINGLSVFMLGSIRFGKPSRITVQTRMGKGRVIDIEREVELGGPIHSKGVLILSSYLAANYALNVPLSLWASIVFEQSYSGVDGDSASAAELVALLSSLSGIPVSQSYAITGSVNQKGEIQAVGGVNEKIEGFFDVCAARGLSGKNGVVIPKANLKNLALRKRVIDAVADGHFNIYIVSTISEAAQFLMQSPFGVRDSSNLYPEGTINALVEARLISYAMKQKDFLGGDSIGVIQDEK